MKELTTKIILLLFMALVCMGLVLMFIYPYRPNSTLVWIVMYLLAIPVYMMAEIIANKTFHNKHIAKLSRPVRLFYGVIMALFLLSALGIIMLSINVVAYFGQWGA